MKFTTQTLFFTGPGRIDFRENDLPALETGQVLVASIYSASSPGTELMVYRGQFPDNIPIDSNLPGMSMPFEYPLAYGYSVVGRVIERGPQVSSAWQDRLVFAFQPHTTRFIASTDQLHPVPDNINPEDAVFLSNMETAVNLVQDGAPLLGERVLVLGQGIIGLLTGSLLAEFPLKSLVTCDLYEIRRSASLALGADSSLDPSMDNFRETAKIILPTGADLTYELSGSPSALDDAIALTAFSGRVVIGSWYGNKRAQVDLGGMFHRSRIRLISSQVSTIAPELSSRWDKPRRFDVAWDALRRIQPGKWVTHRFPLSEAAEVYSLLDKRPNQAIHVIFEY